MKINNKTVRTVALSVVSATALLLAACSNEGHTESDLASTSQFPLSHQQGEIRAEGASSQQKAMEIFGVGYSTLVKGASLSYNATGSGAGQKQFIAGQVDFGGSDTPLSSDQAEVAFQRCEQNPAWHIPLVIGPLAIAYNLDGVGTLNLDTHTIAKMFSGKITSWNDPEIVKQNPDVELPQQIIRVLYRAEESGTSASFQEFLHTVEPELWTTTGKNFPTAVGAGAQGSSGVIGQVAATRGSITYVESGFAKSAGVGIAAVDFGNGPVKLTADSVTKALDNAKFSGKGNDLIIDAPALFSISAQGAYPMVLTSYGLVCSAGYSPETRARVKDFLFTALDNQNSYLEDAGYIPLSGSFESKIVEAVKAL